MIHRARGRTSNNQLETGVRDYAVELIRQSYRDFGPTLATEALQERHGITVGRETVRKWMVDSVLWLSRKQRRTFHQPRLRRESYGELVQIDGSDHRWFEGRGEPCTLLVLIDDATSKLMQLRFVPSESTEAYFQALRGYLEDHGCPVAFYSDKHSVFRPVQQNTRGLQRHGRPAMKPPVSHPSHSPWKSLRDSTHSHRKTMMRYKRQIRLHTQRRFSFAPTCCVAAK